MLETYGRDQSLFSDTILEVVKNVTVTINVLHVTSMTAFRSDAHVGNWSDNPSIHDCSHWCLPGVPDMWNEIILSQLFTDYEFPLLHMESQSEFSYFLLWSIWHDLHLAWFKCILVLVIMFLIETSESKTNNLPLQSYFLIQYQILSLHSLWSPICSYSNLFMSIIP